MVRDARALATELRPGVLDRFGLVSTIEWELQEFSRRTGICATVTVPGADVELDDATATAAYRILQEALTNVARHAEAHHVRVDVSRDASGLTMRVEDDGKGIAPCALGEVRSLGLVGMRERARLARGRFSIARGEKAGTVVTVTFCTSEQRQP